MASEEQFNIGSRTYRKVYPGVFEVPLLELGELRIGDLHPHSTVEVVSLSIDSDDYGFALSVTNGGDAGEHEFLSIFGYVGCEPRGDVKQTMNRLRRAYLPLVEIGALPDPLTVPIKRDDGLHYGAGFTINCADRPEALVREAIKPLFGLFRTLSLPEGRLFLCHASEDKPRARELAVYMSAEGATVWLDEWEIRVGDSIVDKVNSGLEAASHLAILLSKHSVNKPWVRRELSVALMRQLNERAVTVLPVRLDDSPVPVILSDIKYADCRQDMHCGFKQVADALFPRKGGPPRT